MTVALAVHQGLRLQRVGRSWLVLKGREVVGSADDLRHAILAVCLLIEHGAGREASNRPGDLGHRPVPALTLIRR